MKSKQVKVIVDLPANVMAALEDLVKVKNITMTQAIGEAILAYELLITEKQRGSKILIQKPFKKFSKVIL